MDWFESLTGFRETSYDATRAGLAAEGKTLRSRVTGARYGIGELELISLQTLRERAKLAAGLRGRLRASIVTGDVRALHRSRDNAGALFQVASQFNLLEMSSPDITPEHGVTRYEDDHTQGPACAIAAGAATIYRNYFVPVGDGEGQTATRQLDALAEIGVALSTALERPVSDLWRMQNGYAFATQTGLDAIARHLAALPADQVDSLRGALRIGIHRDVEVIDATGPDRPLVSQAFCSALPVAYSDIPAAQWEALAILVLEAAYEATLWAGVLNGLRGGSNRVFLTLLGGGAFGNRAAWIHAALRRGLELMVPFDLDVRLVSYGSPSKETIELINAFR